MTRSALFAGAAGVVALHVADDSFLEPQAGTSAADHLAGGLVPLAALILTVLAFPRLRAGAQAVARARHRLPGPGREQRGAVLHEQGRALRR